MGKDNTDYNSAVYSDGNGALMCYESSAAKYQGYVDDFRVYDQIISAAQIHEMYALTAPAHGIALK